MACIHGIWEDVRGVCWIDAEWRERVHHKLRRRTTLSHIPLSCQLLQYGTQNDRLYLINGSPLALSSLKLAYDARIHSKKATAPIAGSFRSRTHAHATPRPAHNALGATT